MTREQIFFTPLFSLFLSVCLSFTPISSSPPLSFSLFTHQLWISAMLRFSCTSTLTANAFAHIILYIKCTQGILWNSDWFFSVPPFILVFSVRLPFCYRLRNSAVLCSSEVTSLRQHSSFYYLHSFTSFPYVYHCNTPDFFYSELLASLCSQTVSFDINLFWWTYIVQVFAPHNITFSTIVV